MHTEYNWKEGKNFLMVGLPWWFSGLESAFQCKGLGFGP